MAEEPARYCGNCGNELGPTDQFCRSCGAPVHQAAMVPTPEADVNVPPPPPTGGGVAAPQQTSQEGFRQRHPIFTGCLVVVVLLLGLIFVAAVFGGGGGGGDQQASDSAPERAEKGTGVEGGGQQPEANKPEPQRPKPQKTYSVGQTAKVGNVEWTVTDAYLTNRLTSGFGTQKRGRFVVVDFTFTNNRDEEVTIDPELHMILKDSQGREFGPDIDAYEFMPTNLNIFLEPVNPGLSTDGRVIYQVPPDAEGFTLTLDDVEFLEDKSAVFDLANIAPKAYDSSSASATASATASAAAGQ